MRLIKQSEIVEMNDFEHEVINDNATLAIIERMKVFKLIKDALPENQLVGFVDTIRFAALANEAPLGLTAWVSECQCGNIIMFNLSTLLAIKAHRILPIVHHELKHIEDIENGRLYSKFIAPNEIRQCWDGVVYEPKVIVDINEYPNVMFTCPWEIEPHYIQYMTDKVEWWLTYPTLDMEAIKKLWAEHGLLIGDNK